jgi:glucose-6-phosphate isomerase
MMSNYFAQTEALMHGKTAEEVQAEFDEQGLDSERAKFLYHLKFLLATSYQTQFY